jgi:hypothetical protein
MTAQEIEGIHEVNGIGASGEERQRMAQEAFAIVMDGMRTRDAERAVPSPPPGSATRT